MSDKIGAEIASSVAAINSLKEEDIQEIADAIVECLRKGGKVLLCGNGGSAADCQHIAGELICKFKIDRKALPAISLTTDTSVLTALVNDIGGDVIFSRQIAALGDSGDVLMAFSTSGTSSNIIKAVETAKKKKMKVIGFTGVKGKKLAGTCDISLVVNSPDTPKIQEAHIIAAHIICQIVEAEMSK